MEFKLITYFDESYIDSIYETYQSVGWLKHDKDKIRKIFENSTHVVFAIYDNKVIGLLEHYQMVYSMQLFMT